MLRGTLNRCKERLSGHRELSGLASPAGMGNTFSGFTLGLEVLTT